MVCNTHSFLFFQLAYLSIYFRNLGATELRMIRRVGVFLLLALRCAWVRPAVQMYLAWVYYIIQDLLSMKLPDKGFIIQSRVCIHVFVCLFDTILISLIPGEKPCTPYLSCSLSVTASSFATFLANGYGYLGFGYVSRFISGILCGSIYSMHGTPYWSANMWRFLHDNVEGDCTGLLT